jgi:hypothetical protein
MRKWQTFSFYRPNARSEIVQMQKDVFAALCEPIEQVEDRCSHGKFLTDTLRSKVDQTEAVVFFDLDCIPLKPGVVEKAVRAALRSHMIIGCAQQANHIEEEKILMSVRKWPWALRKCESLRRRIWRRMGWDPYHFRNPLIYAGPCFLVVPTAVYHQVGQPSLEPSPRADVAGELTIACQERQVRVKCLQPTYCHVPKFKLGNTRRFGLGTIYGHCIFHAFETTHKGNPLCASLFSEYCLRAIRQYSAKTNPVKDASGCGLPTPISDNVKIDTNPKPA